MNSENKKLDKKRGALKVQHISTKWQRILLRLPPP